MSRRLVIGLLVLGVVVGYGSGIAHLMHGPRCAHGEAWKDRVADVCVRAAERTWSDHRTGASAPAAPTAR